MITAESISRWFKTPHELQEIVPDSLDRLINSFPYFSIGHYLCGLNKGIPTENWADLLRAYPANKVLIQETIQSFFAHNDIEEAEHLFKLSEKLSFQPIYTNDYFKHQGIVVPEEIPENVSDILEKDIAKEEKDLADKSLLVVMSFAEWLAFINRKAKLAKEEEEDQKAFKTRWQKEKLAAAIEEEDEEIPEDVFKMAVSSIAKQEGLVSESLAEVYVRQGKLNNAIDMYKKLSLLNPEKSVYFARRIEHLQKDIQQ